MKLFNIMNGRASGRQTSCMDLSIHHQIRHIKSNIKEFTEMVDEVKTKNVAKNTDYS